MRFTKADLEEFYKLGMKNKVGFIGMQILAKGCNKPEIIINPTENFQQKLDYIRNAYDEDLRLKACKDIKIVALVCGNNFDELEKALNTNITENGENL